MVLCPEGGDGAQPRGFNPISANLMRVFDGRMTFVPEGQADSSQARSAWVCREAPRPGGTVEVKSVPEIFVVETELMPLQKC
jgi:hypothetical protein